ncbi:hypothetical protein HYDPIDRAFT_113359 [Hydnomerulius pinastri MD-312]|uniref:BTB domain-containing protein n=1 Tax=Hydnomerulius pinastri MD-312 TaxID=994086 RepID=A0A0C9VYF3_9AGAM|nr:hypothetical protein HYDPIDRAFT_113359 [Hydnomerulius pinastri MD-312]
MNDFVNHTRFYMNTVTFLVEGCLFKIPRYPFETESTVFKDMFMLPVGDPTNVEGLSNAKPIRLEGIKTDDFDQFLKALLHRSNGQCQDLPVGYEQWTSVLKLSTLWEFTGLRQRAIDTLSALSIPAVEKIVLAYRYNATTWLLPAMNELAQRPEALTVEEAGRLGFEIAFKLASVREQLALRTVSRSLRCSCHSRDGHRCGNRYSWHGYTADGLSVDPGGDSCSGHEYVTNELFVGPRTDAKGLDFTPILRTTFNLKESADLAIS